MTEIYTNGDESYQTCDVFQLNVALSVLDIHAHVMKLPRRNSNVHFIFDMPTHALYTLFTILITLNRSTVRNL